MKERPILFSAPMVRALLSGAKTQTRRIVKPQPEPWCNGFKWDGHIPCHPKKHGACASTDATKFPLMLKPACPYGVPGDRLWVRETAYIAPRRWAEPDHTCIRDSEGFLRHIAYCADLKTGRSEAAEDYYKIKRTSSIHMPRWASRITLEVTGVRVERLQDISEADAVAEGCEQGEPLTHVDIDEMRGTPEGELAEILGVGSYATAKLNYSMLWESINGPGSWESNCWVWVIEFKRLDVSS